MSRRLFDEECDSDCTGLTTQRQRNLPTTTTTIYLPNGHHVLKQLLPDKTNYLYNLRNRRRNPSLTVKTDAPYFVVRQLFKDIS